MKFFFNRVIKNKGQAASVLNLFLAVFVIGVLGIFSVELSRYFLARDQLQGHVEAAALCCQTALTSTGSPTDRSNQSSAEQIGLNLFQQNSILGQSLSNATLVSLAHGDTSPQFDVPGGEAQICFQFLDPITRLPTTNSPGIQNTSSTGTSGTLIQATGAYSYVPLFGQFIGLGNAQFTFQTSANSGIPKLDLVFVYDVSGAENTQTPVTYTQRFYHDPYGIDYLIPSPINSPPTSVGTGGPLWPFCKTTAPEQGPNTNTPQVLDNGANCPSPQLNYSELSGAPTQLLTGIQGYAAPPGNFTPMSGHFTPGNGNTTYCMAWSYTSSYSGVGGTQGIMYMPIPNIMTMSDFLSFGWAAVAVDLSQFTAVSTASLFGPTEPFFTFHYKGTPYQYYTLYLNPISGGNFMSPVTQSTSNYQAPIMLNNGTIVTVQMGGGSSAGSSVQPPQATGPYPATTPSGGTTVGSIVSGRTYDVNGHSFTDSVVNLDNNPTFNNASVTYNGSTYKFPSLGALVEASRGNLESPANAQAAGLNLSAMGLIQSDLQAGYYAAYNQAAMQSTQPMNTVANSTIAFMNQLATVSDAHFGAVTFNDYVGTSASSAIPPNAATSYSFDLMQAAMAIPPIVPPAPHPTPPGQAPYNIANSYPYPSMDINPDATVSPSTTNTYLMPNIPLDPNSNSTPATIASVLPTLHTWGNCSVATGLNAALAELAPQIVGSANASLARPSANKAIILITVQAPNVGLNDSGGTALSDAQQQAALASAAGIPIYCLSISQSDSDDTNEDAAYNSIVAAAGHGSKYYRVRWSTPAGTQSAVTTVFGNIARQLVSVIR